MVREGYYEPERVFPPPRINPLTADLELLAFEILELYVWVYRISQAGHILREGIGWDLAQRWYDAGSDDKKLRIGAALDYLVSEGHLREGVPASIWPSHTRKSDHYFPTEKAFSSVDRRQSSRLKKLWLTLSDRPQVIAAVGAVVLTFALGVMKDNFGSVWLAVLTLAEAVRALAR